MRKGIFRTSALDGIRWRWAWPSLLALTISLAIWWWPSETQHLGISSHSSTQVSKAMTWKLVLNDQPSPTTAPIEDPEAQVRQIYQALGEGQRQQALQLAEQLSLQFPNFQLGQLLYADLLNISAQTPQDQNQWLPEHESVSTRLKDLVLEAQRRLTHPGTAQVDGKRPLQLLMLGKEHPYLVVVDAITAVLVCQYSAQGGRYRLEAAEQHLCFCRAKRHRQKQGRRWQDPLGRVLYPAQTLWTHFAGPLRCRCHHPQLPQRH
jgi:hypothetical protein